MTQDELRVPQLLSSHSKGIWPRDVLKGGQIPAYFLRSQRRTRTMADFKGRVSARNHERNQ